MNQKNTKTKESGDVCISQYICVCSLENNDYAAQKTWPNNEPRTLNDDGDPAEVSNIWYRGVSGESGGVKCSQ